MHFASFVFVLLPAAVAMRAFVALSAGNSTYDATFPKPAIGSLHAQYSGLPSECECLVKVMASSVNPSDINPSIAVLPHVMGSDIAGVIEQLGNGCSRLKIGDRVWGDIGANTKTTTGVKTKELGGYGAYAVALESQLGIMPTNIGFIEAGSLPKVALTSYKALVWYAEAKNDTLWRHSPTVLVLGGSGGTGSVGIQMARTFGAGKIITTTAAANFAYCRSLGANQLIDYHTQDWWTVLQSNSVDVVYDTVGQAGTGDRAMDKLRVGGHYVTITGALASKVKEGVTQSMFINSDTNLANVEELDAIRTLVEADELRMRRIQAIFPLDQIPAAFALSKTGQTVGKAVISIANFSGSDIEVTSKYISTNA